MVSFWQWTNLPARKFEVSQKLELTDPADPKIAYIASVEQVQGYRIRLRLDGSDSSHDFWRLAYSPDIHPVGFSNENGQTIQLPPGKVIHVVVIWKTMLSTVNTCTCILDQIIRSTWYRGSLLVQNPGDTFEIITNMIILSCHWQKSTQMACTCNDVY